MLKTRSARSEVRTAWCQFQCVPHCRNNANNAACLQFTHPHCTEASRRTCDFKNRQNANLTKTRFVRRLWACAYSRHAGTQDLLSCDLDSRGCALRPLPSSFQSLVTITRPNKREAPLIYEMSTRRVYKNLFMVGRRFKGVRTGVF